MKTLRIVAPQVETAGDEERVTLEIGGYEFFLVGPNSKEVRGLAIALHMAKAMTLVVEEHDKAKIPEVYL